MDSFVQIPLGSRPISPMFLFPADAKCSAWAGYLNTLLSIPTGIALIILHLLLASDYETRMKPVLEGWLSMSRVLLQSERSEKTFFFLSPFSKITNNNRDVVKWGGKAAQISRPFRGPDLSC